MYKQSLFKNGFIIAKLSATGNRISRNIGFILSILIALMTLTGEYRKHYLITELRHKIDFNIAATRNKTEQLTLLARSKIIAVNNSDDIIHENIALKKELNELRTANTLLKRHADENSFLKATLNLVSYYDVNYIITAVIGVQRNDNRERIYLSAPSPDYIIPINAPIINAKGLIGKISHTQDDMIIVSTFKDKLFRMPVIIKETDERAILAGGREPELLYMEDGSPTLTGYTILTDNTETGMIPNYPIGTVQKENNRYKINPSAILGNETYLTILIGNIQSQARKTQK